jgi:hypothetical protein
MTRACIIKVRDATGNIFTDDEVDDIINRVADRAVRARRATPDLSDQAAIHQAAREVTVAELKAELIEKRSQMAAEAARKIRRPRIDVMRKAGLTEAQALDAVNVGAERQAPGAATLFDAWSEPRNNRLPTRPRKHG